MDKKVEVVSENQNTVILLGAYAQPTTEMADRICGKYGRSSRLLREWGGTRIERSYWQFDCIR
jgi:hypothetical protein